MGDESSTPKTAEAEIHGEMVLAEAIPGYKPQEPKKPKREIDPQIVKAARRVS